MEDLIWRGDALLECEDAISIEVAIQTTWMILNGMGYPKDQNEELDQTIKAVFDTAPRVATSIDLVRCKECKNKGTEDCPMKDWNYTWGEYEYFNVDDDFCSYGERKESE